jgi:hypothetical protein
MKAMRAAALAAIAVLVAAATSASFAESYRALLDWASHHGVHGLWAGVWPLQVDVFIAVGELALFVALADRWNARSRAAAWTVTLAGLAVSVAGNIGHTGSHDWASRATAAVPPLAAAAALAVGLGVLKRVVASQRQPVPEPEIQHLTTDQLLSSLNGHAAEASERFADYIEAGKVPAIRDIRERMHVGQPKAQQVQAYLRSLTRT